MNVQHQHLSPLDDQPNLHPEDVLRVARDQPANAAGDGPRDYCGLWRDGEWHDVDGAPHDSFWVHGPWSGHQVRHVTQADLGATQQGA